MTKSKRQTFASLEWVSQVLRLTDKSRTYEVFRDAVHRGKRAFPGLGSREARMISDATGCPFYRKSSEDLPDLLLWVATFCDSEMVTNIRNKAMQRSSFERRVVVQKFGLLEDDDAGVFHHMHASTIPQPELLNGRVVSYSLLGQSYTRRELRDAVRSRALSALKASDALSTLVARSGESLPLMLELIRGARRRLAEAEGRRREKPSKEELDRRAESQVMAALHAELIGPGEAGPDRKADPPPHPKVAEYVRRKVSKLDPESRESLRTSAVALSTVRATQPDPERLKSSLEAEDEAETPQTDASLGASLRWSLYDRGIEYVNEVRKLGARCTFFSAEEGKRAPSLKRLPAYRIVSFPHAENGREWACYDVVELFRYVRDFAAPAPAPAPASGEEDLRATKLAQVLAAAGLGASDVPFPNSGVGRRMSDVDLNRLQIWHESYWTLEGMLKTMSPADRAAIERVSEKLVPSQIADSEAGWGRWVGRKVYNALTYSNPDRPYLRAYGTRDVIYGTVRGSEFVLSWLPYTLGVHTLLTVLEGLLCILAKVFVVTSFTGVGVASVLAAEVKASVATYLRSSIVSLLRELWAKMVAMAQSKYSGALAAFVIGMVGRWLGFPPLVALADWVRAGADSTAFKVAAFSVSAVGVMVGLAATSSVSGYLWDGMLGEEQGGTLLTARFMRSIRDLAGSMPVLGPVYNFVTQASSPTSWVGAEHTANLAMYMATAFSQIMCRAFSFLGKRLEDGCRSMMSFAARHLGHAVIVSKILRITWDVGYFMFTGGTRLLFTPCFSHAAISYHALDVRLDRESGPVVETDRRLSVGDAVIEHTGKGGRLRESLGAVFGGGGYEGAKLRYRLNKDVADYRAAEVSLLKEDLGVDGNAALIAYEERELGRTAEEIRRDAKEAAEKKKELEKRESPPPVLALEFKEDGFNIFLNALTQTIEDHETSAKRCEATVFQKTTERDAAAKLLAEKKSMVAERRKLIEGHTSAIEQQDQNAADVAGHRREVLAAPETSSEKGNAVAVRGEPGQEEDREQGGSEVIVYEAEVTEDLEEYESQNSKHVNRREAHVKQIGILERACSEEDVKIAELETKVNTLERDIENTVTERDEHLKSAEAARNRLEIVSRNNPKDLVEHINWFKHVTDPQKIDARKSVLKIQKDVLSQLQEGQVLKVFFSQEILVAFRRLDGNTSLEIGRAAANQVMADISNHAISKVTKDVASTGAANKIPEVLERIRAQTQEELKNADGLVNNELFRRVCRHPQNDASTILKAAYMIVAGMDWGTLVNEGVHVLEGDWLKETPTFSILDSPASNSWFTFGMKMVSGIAGFAFSAGLAAAGIR